MAGLLVCVGTISWREPRCSAADLKLKKDDISVLSLRPPK
jgi:hypothetical protein